MYNIREKITCLPRLKPTTSKIIFRYKTLVRPHQSKAWFCKIICTENVARCFFSVTSNEVVKDVSMHISERVNSLREVEFPYTFEILHPHFPNSKFTKLQHVSLHSVKPVNWRTQASIANNKKSVPSLYPCVLGGGDSSSLYTSLLTLYRDTYYHTSEKAPGGL